MQGQQPSPEQIFRNVSMLINFLPGFIRQKIYKNMFWVEVENYKQIPDEYKPFMEKLLTHDIEFYSQNGSLDF